jgi:U3 small nucleolar RNA-associated protein 3
VACAHHTIPACALWLARQSHKFAQHLQAGGSVRGGAGPASSKGVEFMALDGGDDGGEEDEFDEEPVFDLAFGGGRSSGAGGRPRPGADSDDDGGGDDDGANDDDGGDSDDDDEEEAEAEARKREEAVTTAWGKRRGAFYDNEGDVEVDEEAAAAEEEEAIRLQRRRAAELDDDDAGLTTVLGRAVASRRPVARPESDEDDVPAEERSLGARLTGKKAVDAAAKPASAVKATPAQRGAGGVQTVSKQLGGLSKQAKLEAVLADTPELVGLLEELRDRTAEIRNVLAPILEAAAAGRLAGGEGVSFLELKNNLLLTYCTNITFYLLLRAEGRSVRDHPVIAQLVTIRALLDKVSRRW